ncbi:MAG TPA: hypothetical protein PLD73_17755 [Candidatus Hydrogenedentes bacterium]|nr:hypothetical protein [Candidatus Hydrogenedentota bacterium]
MNAPRGLYEQVIDQMLAGRIAQLDLQRTTVSKERLDPGESHVTLAQHLMGIIQAGLRMVNGKAAWITN